MDSKLPVLGTESSANSSISSHIKLPDKLNFQIADLVDDLMVYSYLDTSAHPESANVLDSVTQRIADLRASIQAAKELCRPRVQTEESVGAAGVAPSTVGSTPGSAGTPRAPPQASTAVGQSLSLFQSSLDLDPAAQQRLLKAVATACVVKRNLLVELNKELQELKAQEDKFSI